MASGNADTSREALCNALVRVAAERGWRRTSVERVAREAGLAPHELYDHFRSLEHCLVAVHDRMLARVTRTAARAAAAHALAVGPGPWREQLDAVLGSVLTFFSLEPALARTCLVEILEAGPLARARRDDALDRFTAYVEGLRLTHGEPIPPLAAELIVLGTTDLIYTRVARGETDALPQLMPDLRCLWVDTVERHSTVAAAASKVTVR